MKSTKNLKLILLISILVFIIGFYKVNFTSPSEESSTKQQFSPSFIKTMQPTDDNYEENDYYYEAYNLSSYIGIALYSIDGYGIQADDDWYEIYVSPGHERLLVALLFSHSEGDIDIEVYDSSISYITGNFSVTDDEFINYIVPSSGTYYLRIYLADAGNEYDLWWNTYSYINDDNYEQNDGYLSAYDISPFENVWLNTINGMGVQLDEDWYEIFIARGFEHVIVDLTFSHSSGNIDLAVYDDYGSLIISSTSLTDNEKIDYRLPYNGTFYIKVYGDNSGNSYNLKWDAMFAGPQIPGYNLSILFGITLIISIIFVIEIVKKKPIVQKK